MAWNQPGGQDEDPWNKSKRKDERDGDGPPDLDVALGELLKRFGGIFGGRQGGSGSGGGGFSIGPWLIILILTVVGTLYLFFGVYTLDQQERGVVLRFGSLQENLQMPGLRWNPPIIDEVVVINVTRVNNIRHQTLMLTADENIVDITMSVQYLIANPSEYVVAVRDPRQSLESASESALRHVVGSSSMDSVLTEGREQVADEVQERLQRYIDLYRTGIQVVKVNIDDSQPPTQVASAFDDVQAAQEDNQRLVNEASAYRESVVPQARGEAQKQIEEATAYREKVISRAEGEASRFTQLLVEYQNAPDVTRNRLYLDAMESIFSNTTKILVNVEGGNNLLYLPLDQLIKNRTSSNQNDGTLGSEEMRRLVRDAVLREINSRTGNSGRREGRPSR